MRSTMCRRRLNPFPNMGMTLLELIIATAILLALSSAALPIVRFRIVGQRETELRRDLREMRDAIDRYKDLADQGKILRFSRSEIEVARSSAPAGAPPHCADPGRPFRPVRNSSVHRR